MSLSLLMPLLLSRSARQRILDEMQQHIQQHFTKDPALPGPLANLVSALVRIFWADMVLELELDFDRGGQREDEGDEPGNSPESQEGPLGRALMPLLGPTSTSRSGREREAELAAASDIASGLLQVLVVEARDLMPVHGIGTNPYVRGILGQQVRRSRTVWSNLRPAWNCLMEFSVVSPRGNLELEVMSRAPLFGGDTRLGYVSLPLKDICCPASSSGTTAAVVAAAVNGAPPPSTLLYRCEPLAGAEKGELVLILDYQELHPPRWGAGGLSRCISCGVVFRAAARRGTQFRAFFLYHYWPCDKSIFQMYLHEPVDICLLFLALSPFILVRAVFYTVLLVCLCVQWPPDEHQIVQFILALKGTAIITDGAGRLTYGVCAYYLCARAGTCSTGGAPGSGVGAFSVALELYQEVLVWAVCFWLLPLSLPFERRSPGVKTPRATGEQAASPAEDASRGGRMKALLQYNLLAFAFSFLLFTLLCLRDVWAVGFASQSWRWHLTENFFWSRTVFGLCMFPFLFLMQPQINKLLTHSTPTGYTRLGTLRRHNPRFGRNMPTESENASMAEGSPQTAGTATASYDSINKAVEVAAAHEEARLHAPTKDPVEELKDAIRRFPGGSFALRAGAFGLQMTNATVSAAVTIVSFEIRVASAAVSLGLRAADTGRGAALGIARRLVPGSDTVAVRIVLAGTEAVEATAVAIVSRCDRALQRPVALAAAITRCLPGGPTALTALDTMTTVTGRVLRTAARMAAVAESTGANRSHVGWLSEHMSEDTNLCPESNCTIEMLQAAGGSELAELSERADMLKLEAAARLAEMLTRAERMAERETAEAREALQRVRPEITKISEALRERRKTWRTKMSRAYDACDSLSRSVLAWTLDVTLRLPSAGQVLIEATNRELNELHAQGDLQKSWARSTEAYSRVFLSSICEALLELSPGLALPPASTGGLSPCMTPVASSSNLGQASARCARSVRETTAQDCSYVGEGSACRAHSESSMSKLTATDSVAAHSSNHLKPGRYTASSALRFRSRSSSRALQVTRDIANPEMSQSFDIQLTTSGTMTSEALAAAAG